MSGVILEIIMNGLGVVLRDGTTQMYFLIFSEWNKVTVEPQSLEDPMGLFMSPTEKEIILCMRRL